MMNLQYLSVSLLDINLRARFSLHHVNITFALRGHSIDCN